MSSDVFIKAYQKLNPTQQLAVDTIDGPVMVIAGPGTGKTQMLTMRIAKILIETDTLPENILALTFTEAGVMAMRKRLLAIIGPLAYRVNIFTFHGLSSHAIQAYPDNFAHLVGASPISEIEQVEILEQIISSHQFNQIKNFADPYVYLAAAKSAITELKRENITPDKFAVILDQQQQDIETADDLYHAKGRFKGQIKADYKKQLGIITKNRDLLKVYRHYQERLTNDRFYDYEDMLLELIKAMEHDPDFLLTLQEQYHYFLIDEHQDTNRSQNRIVELLASYHDNPNVFAVGDEKQAIYRFQGASITNFLYLKQNYPAAKVISLEDNYRSSQLILDCAHSLVEQLPTPEVDLPLRNQLKAHNSPDQTQIQVIELADYTAEYYYVAEDIKKALEQGTSAQEIAVLGRNNADLHDMMLVLKQQKIPYILRSNLNILDDMQIQKFINLLRMVTEPGNDIWLIKSLITDIAQVHPLDVFQIQAMAKDAKVSAWHILSKADFGSSNWIDGAKLSSWYQSLISWTKAAANNHPDETFTQILKESGILGQILTKAELVEGLDGFVSLFGQLRQKQQRYSRYTLKDFVGFINLVENHRLKLTGSVATLQAEAVQLMTAHGSKGLEFDRVYILNCFDQKWGGSYSGGPQFKLPYEYMGTIASTKLSVDKQADERRLFYVALTRARTHLTLSYTLARQDGREQGPSRFLGDLDTSLITRADVSQFEAQWPLVRHQILSVTQSVEQSSAQLKKSLTPKVAELFDLQGFSVSALNNYLACPWKYFFRNLMRIPETKSLNLVFGSVIHESINLWVRADKQDKKTLLEAFEQSLVSQNLDPIETEELRAKGAEVIDFYYQARMSHWPKQLLSEVKVSGVGLEPDIKLSGKLDLLIPLGGNQVRVVDFKTGKPKTRGVIEGTTKEATGDYFRQLVFYKLLLDRFHGGKYQMVEGVLDFVQPNGSGKFISESFTIDHQQVSELEQQIVEAAGQIRRLDFWDTFCPKSKCEYCQLRQTMTPDLYNQS